MRSPLPVPILIVVATIALAASGCQPSGPRAVPSVPQIGADLKCSQGDHGYEDVALGWGFCYPGTWRYLEHSQQLAAPDGVDLTFDITCLSECRSATPSAGPANNLFGYMIVSTYQRGSATDLEGWVAANMKPAPQLGDSIDWGNAVQAARLPDGRRIALTPHFVVILDVRSGTLDLEDEMSSRLGSWKFSL
jgi:hypothetical protein